MASRFCSIIEGQNSPRLDLRTPLQVLGDSGPLAEVNDMKVIFSDKLKHVELTFAVGNLFGAHVAAYCEQ
jgi:hypothetical protein